MDVGYTPVPGKTGLVTLQLWKKHQEITDI